MEDQSSHCLKAAEGSEKNGKKSEGQQVHRKIHNDFPLLMKNGRSFGKADLLPTTLK